MPKFTKRDYEHALDLACRYLVEPNETSIRDNEITIRVLRAGRPGHEWQGRSYPPKPPLSYEALLADTLQELVDEARAKIAKKPGQVAAAGPPSGDSGDD